MDFAGPFEGKMILVIIVSYSKWIEAYPTSGATSTVVVELSRTLFAQFGVPEVIVTDNGSCFVSEKFGTFLLKNGIKHITSAPYHPATNGLAEWTVQTMKRGLKKLRDGSVASRLAKILLAHWTAPQSTTGESPAQLLQNRQIRTRLDLIKPSRSHQVDHCQQQQKVCHDESAKRKQFSKGERVYVRNFGTGTRWLPVIVEEITGPVSCLVILEDNRLIRRHFDHITRRRHESKSLVGSDSDVQEVEKEFEEVPYSALLTPGSDTYMDSSLPDSSGREEPPQEEIGSVPEAQPLQEPVAEVNPSHVSHSGVVKTYQKRQCRPPDR